MVRRSAAFPGTIYSAANFINFEIPDGLNKGGSVQMSQEALENFRDVFCEDTQLQEMASFQTLNSIWSLVVAAYQIKVGGKKNRFRQYPRIVV